MVAASVAALTVYDMVKGLERGVVIEEVALLEKTGGRHDWRGDGDADRASRSSRSARRARRAGGADESGDELVAFAHELGGEIVAREIVSDERDEIEARLRELQRRRRCDLILTTGGTGVAPRDVTPEATLAVIEREVPGIAEAMREASRPHTRHWMLSRGVAGIRGRDADRQLPRQPAQHRARRGGDRRRAAARARADRGRPDDARVG